MLSIMSANRRLGLSEGNEAVLVDLAAQASVTLGLDDHVHGAAQQFRDPNLYPVKPIENSKATFSLGELQSDNNIDVRSGTGLSSSSRAENGRGFEPQASQLGLMLTKNCQRHVCLHARIMPEYAT